MWGYRDKSGKLKPPLIYDSGKTQETVFYEVLEALDDNELVYLQGGVGTGKSVIALHLIDHYRKGIIAVPTKVLEKQYVQDYCGKNKPYIRTRETPLRVNNLRGRTNFKCLTKKHLNCGNRDLPCTRRLEEDETRAEIALDCSHWSPVYLAAMVPAAVKRERSLQLYESVGGPRVYCEADEPCPFYKQFRHFIPEGAIIMNAAKWEAETWMKRKPAVQVEIIDEADTFLDGLSYRVTVNRRLLEALRREKLVTEQDHQNLEQKLAQYTYVYKDRREFELSSSPELLSFLSFLNTLLAKAESPALVSDQFKLSVLLEYQQNAWAYVTGVDGARGLAFYIPRMDITLGELRKRSGKIVLMSATRHSDEAMKSIFRVRPPVVLAKEENPGTLYLMTPRDGGLLNVCHRNWEKNQNFHEEYWKLLDEQLQAAKRPCYVLVHAWKYLPERYKPTKMEKTRITWQRPELTNVYFSTKMDRGVDLKDDKCRAIILLKYPWPDLEDPVLKTMRKQYGESAFWAYAKDHADRNLIQQCGRAIRNAGDWCQVYSPDRNVIEALERVWKGHLIKANHPGE